MTQATFRLDDRFVDQYRDRTPPFGFGALSQIVYLRTYSRIKPNGENEEWYETVRRVVEGTFRMQERHIRQQDLGWNDSRAQKSAQEMYDRMFDMKFLPPGRGIWAMGSPITEEKELFGSLCNCAFVSTKRSERKRTEPFTFLMDASMLGVGVGFDLKGAGQFIIQQPGTQESPPHPVRKLYPYLKDREKTVDWEGNPVEFCYEVQDGVFVVPDTREGWVACALFILNAFFYGHTLPDFDFHQIRPPGVPIKTFGGTSSGPKPLRDMIAMLTERLSREVNQLISGELILDLMNMIGVCVVSGNLRRTAEICLGELEDPNYLSLKDYRYNTTTGQYEGSRADRAAFGWTSNNSVLGQLGMSYGLIAQHSRVNGEPGVAWLENMRAFGRMGDPPNFKDIKVLGTNPCGEQSLEDEEMCCLVENFIDRHDDLEDFKRTLKCAYLYAKTVTLGKTHWPGTNRVMLRNRRIGSSLAGVVQFVDNHGLDTLKQWCHAGYQVIEEYDRIYSDWLCVPQSIKRTSIKPGGCRPWDALTSTDQGLLTLEELFSEHPEDAVWHSVEGLKAIQGNETKPITKTFNNGVAPVLRIRTAYNIEVRSTENHQWWVEKRYDYTKRHLKGSKGYYPVQAWVKAEDLVPGDILEIVPSAYTKEEHKKLAKLSSLALKMRGDATEIQQPSYMNPDLAWLLGYLWGDGSLSPSKYRMRFIDSNYENLEKACRILLEQFGLVASIKSASEGKKAHVVDVGSKFLWHWLIRNDLFKYYHDRLDLIPAPVRGSAHEDILAFLAGLIDADGCVCPRLNDRVIILATADPEFARHVQDVALAAGIVFGRSLNQGGVNRQMVKSMWLMTLAPESNPERFRLLARHSNKVKVSDLAETGLPWAHERASRSRIFGKVESVELIGDLPTYDIEVSDNHWYYAGAVKSHNTVPKLPGSTPGGHWPEAIYMIRRVRLSRYSNLIEGLQEAGYPLEPAQEDPTGETLVVEIPTRVAGCKRDVTQVSMWEQLEMAAFLQEHWADNQVSYTVKFDPATEGPQIEHALNYYQYRLKSISFLPLTEEGAYAQMPEEKITEEEYLARTANLKPLLFRKITGELAEAERFCDSDTCTVSLT